VVLLIYPSTLPSLSPDTNRDASLAASEGSVRSEGLVERGNTVGRIFEAIPAHGMTLPKYNPNTTCSTAVHSGAHARRTCRCGWCPRSNGAPTAPGVPYWSGPCRRRRRRRKGGFPNVARAVCCPRAPCTLSWRVASSRWSRRWSSRRMSRAGWTRHSLLRCESVRMLRFVSPCPCLKADVHPSQ
jgi:hypothetical protein